jgi:carotenoid cleavage dioxygenase-like enzyme
VLPKYEEDAAKVRWFELPAAYAFHVANAWQEGDKIRIFLSLYEEGVSLSLSS